MNLYTSTKAIYFNYGEKAVEWLNMQNMQNKSLYWAGPRCFVASMRHFDSGTIDVLEKDYGWTVYIPLELVAKAIKTDNRAPLFGINGIIRKTCFDFIDKSDIVVAYTGLIWDTGTAREIEYATTKNKPILAWSDASVVFGETLGRIAVVDGKDIDQLYVKTMPFNGMDVVFNRFLELSQLYDYHLTEEALAQEIDRECTKLLTEVKTN